MRILLVEDDHMIGQAVSDVLSDNAYAVDWVTDGQSALEAINDVQYECILLDLGLPKIDGIKVLEIMRANKIKTSVIILTARDELPDKITGLDKGADDYIVKPFEMQELLARIRAVTRRRNSGNVESMQTYGCLGLDPVNHEVRINSPEESKNISLTAREFALLEALMRRPGAVLSRDALEQRIYSWDDEIDSNAVEYIIYTLRRKIGQNLIKNVRGVGWKLEKIEDPSQLQDDKDKRRARSGA